jgi:hypothetical protein
MFQWFKQRKLNNLKVKLAGKKARYAFMSNALHGQKVNSYYLDEALNLYEVIAKLEMEIELLMKGDKNASDN